MSALSFSQNTPNKIGNGIKVSGKNTLMKTEGENGFRVAIADEPFDAKVDGKKMFCVRVDDAGLNSDMMIGFTPMDTFDSNTTAYFGSKDFGCGLLVGIGYLYSPVNKNHNIINKEISKKAKEIIAVLTVSNNGKKKEIRFFCDGKESKSTDVSEHLNGDLVFPAICLRGKNDQVTTISIDQIQTRTPAIENLTKEYQQQKNNQNNTQSGVGAVASSSSAAMIQLQKELIAALQKNAALSSQLQEQKQKSSDLENEFQKLKEQNQK
jgi:hypothetical protein